MRLMIHLLKYSSERSGIIGTMTTKNLALTRTFDNSMYKSSSQSTMSDKRRNQRQLLQRSRKRTKERKQETVSDYYT
jgi:hypothetical protein